MTIERIYDAIGVEVGHLENGEKIFFYGQLVGSVLNQEYWDTQGWYMGKWMGKEALGKVFDLGMERHGYMVATTEINDCITPIDVAKFLVRNRANLVIGTADTPVAAGALAIFYYREQLPLSRPDFQAKKILVMDYSMEQITVDATQDFLASRFDTIVEEMILQREIFTHWIEFFLVEFEDSRLIHAVKTYEAKLGFLLDRITQRFKEVRKENQNLVTRQMRRFLTSSFYFFAAWANVREALSQRLIRKYRNFHRLADAIIYDCKEFFFTRAREEKLNLLDRTRMEIFSGFFMDFGEDIKVNYATSPFALMGIPFEEMEHPWNWMSLGFELGMEVYHNVRALKEELKLSLYEFLYDNFQPEVKVHWFPWRHYLFSDIFAILLFGPTMVQFFADNRFQEMVDLQIEFNRERNIWEQEPLDYVRFLVQSTLLKRLGFGTLAREMEAKIQPIALCPDKILVDGTEIETARFLDPAKQMIALILNSRLKSLKEKHLTHFINFTPLDQKLVLEYRETILAGQMPEGANWRYLVPAAYLAHAAGKSRQDLLNVLFRKIL